MQHPPSKQQIDKMWQRYEDVVTDAQREEDVTPKEKALYVELVAENPKLGALSPLYIKRLLSMEALTQLYPGSCTYCGGKGRELFTFTHGELESVEEFEMTEPLPGDKRVCEVCRWQLTGNLRGSGWTLPYTKPAHYPEL